MLDRLLVDNEEWYISVGWLGTGAVKTLHKPTGRRGAARGPAKTYFLDLCEALKSRNSMTPGNPLFVECVSAFAYAVTMPGLKAECLLNEMARQSAAEFVSSAVSAVSQFDCG